MSADLIAGEPRKIPEGFKDMHDGSYARIVSLSGDAAAGAAPHVNTLAELGVARQLPASASSANTVLTATCRRISIKARGGDIRYAIGAAAQTANAATGHYIASGERLDLAVPASAQIAVIWATGGSAGALEVSELV